MEAMQSTTTAIRPYRIYLLDPSNVQAPPFEVELASDKDARHFAALMLDKQATIHPCAEVWDGARLVCTLRRGE
jgi:hypothetical protein